jgi:predicted permease
LTFGALFGYIKISMTNEALLHIVYILLAVLLFAAILSVGFKTNLKDFLKSKAARNILSAIIISFGALMCIGAVGGAISSKQNYDSSTKICRTKVFDDNTSIIGYDEPLEGLKTPIYDYTFAKIERDKCVNNSNAALVQQLVLFGVILLLGIGVVVFGVLIVREKIFAPKKKKSTKR